MKISVDVRMRVGDEDLAPGEYDVAVDEAASRISLRRDGAEIANEPATARSAKMQVKRPTATLLQVKGEPRRLLIARTSSGREWVLSLHERT